MRRAPIKPNSCAKASSSDCSRTGLVNTASMIPGVPSARPCRPADDAMTILVSARPARRANPLGQCLARKAGHHLVDDDEIKWLALVKGTLQFGHRGESVIDRHRLDPEAGQLPRQNAPVHLDIIDDQDVETRQFARAMRGVRSSD